MFAWSVDGKGFEPMGGEFEMIFQLKTFQGVRFALFAFNDSEKSGGAADFDSFVADEPNPRGLMRPIPFGRMITLTVHERDAAIGVKEGELAAVPLKDAARFAVIDAGLGRVALRAEDGRLMAVAEGGRVVLVGSEAGTATSYQWTETVYGDLILLSLATDRHVRIDPVSRKISATHAGPAPDRRDGSCFDWTLHQP